MPTFEFVSSYRTLVPQASRELIEARGRSHEILIKDAKNLEHIFDLVRLAFQLKDRRLEVEHWFQAVIRKSDPQFSLDHDVAESARIASLVLHQRVSEGDLRCATAVIIGSYQGGRASIDDGALLRCCTAALLDAARARRSVSAPAIKYAGKGDISAALAAISAGTPDVYQAAAKAVFDDAHDAGSRLAAVTQVAATGLASDIARLAEEVDMLWWHVGGWSELLDASFSSLPASAVPLIAGIDLAMLSRKLPGPYGARGILMRTIGSSADGDGDIVKAVSGCSRDQLKLLTVNSKAVFEDLFPVHTAIQLAVEADGSTWKETFTRRAAIPKSAKISLLALATQSYFERLLLRGV